MTSVIIKFVTRVSTRQAKLSETRVARLAALTCCDEAQVARGDRQLIEFVRDLKQLVLSLVSA